MHQQKGWMNIVFVCMLLVISGCATQGAPHVPQAIPPDSPFAHIREGMGMAELLSLLGPPTDQEIFMTGKMSLPFSVGADRSVNRLHYKGLGRIYMSGQGRAGGGERVMIIEYDPQESGYRK